MYVDQKPLSSLGSRNPLSPDAEPKELAKVWRQCDGGIAIIFGVQRHINRIDEIA
jgi:hypothetical protein